MGSVLNPFSLLCLGSLLGGATPIVTSNPLESLFIGVIYASILHFFREFIDRCSLCTQLTPLSEFFASHIIWDACITFYEYCACQFFLQKCYVRPVVTVKYPVLSIGASKGT